MEQILTKNVQEELSLLIEKCSRVVCIGHVNPDGDALGSTLMIAKWLRRKGKTAHVVMPNRFPDFLSGIPNAEEILCYDSFQEKVEELISEADLIVMCDYSQRDRMGELRQIVESNPCPRITVDHHLNPENYCDITISRAEMCATCEVLCHVMNELGEMETLPVDEAECLYAGMMTDTGAFTYNSNRSDVYECISMLIRRGIDKDKLYRRLYWTMSPAKLRLEGYMLYCKMHLIPEMHVAYMILNNKERRMLGTKNGDTEGIVNMPLQIYGTKLSCLMSQDTEHPEQYRVSLRSVDDFPCNELSADFFSGGGHKNAAGGRFVGTESQVTEQFIKAVKKYENMLKN